MFGFPDNARTHSLTNTWAGYTALFAFFIAYSLVIFEEKIQLRKSKPVVLFGCFMWMIIGIYEAGHGGGGRAEEEVTHLIAEIGALFFFLLVAMTYINALEERNGFVSLRSGPPEKCRPWNLKTCFFPPL